MEPEPFSQRVKTLRERNGLSQKDLAAKMGVTQPQVSQIEKGTKVPSADRIDQLASALEKSALDLVANTSVESKYRSERVTLEDDVMRETRDRRQRSIVFVKIDLLCHRLRAFVNVVHDGEVYPPSIDEEAHYQRLRRTCLRLIQEAEAFELDLSKKIPVSETLIEDPDDHPSLTSWYRLKRDLARGHAYVRSLILDYPEANNQADLTRLSKELGLSATDDVIRELVIAKRREEEAAYGRYEHDEVLNEFDLDWIPF